MEICNIILGRFGVFDCYTTGYSYLAGLVFTHFLSNKLESLGEEPITKTIVELDGHTLNINQYYTDHLLTTFAVCFEPDDTHLINYGFDELVKYPSKFRDCAVTDIYTIAESIIGNKYLSRRLISEDIANLKRNYIELFHLRNFRKHYKFYKLTSSQRLSDFAGKNDEITLSIKAKLIKLAFQVLSVENHDKKCYVCPYCNNYIVEDYLVKNIEKCPYCGFTTDWSIVGYRRCKEVSWS